MKKIILAIIFIIVFPITILAQKKHNINAGFDFSFGIYYFDSDINNPTAYSPFIGYEYNLFDFLGLGLGLKYGGFNQRIGYNRTDVIQPPMNPEYLAHDIYRGTTFSPYISSKLLFDISRTKSSKYLFLENRLLYTIAQLNLDRIEGLNGKKSRNNLDYEVRFGYMHSLNDNWVLMCWAGYSTFNFSRVDPENIKFKNSTPILIGIGFEYSF